MKNTLLALALVLSILTISATSQQPKPGPSASWEYKFDYKCNEKRANDLAGEGWEMMEMSTASYGTVPAVTCVFKRGK